MTTKTINLQTFQPQLADLLPLIAAGNEVILTEGDRPIARLMPFVSRSTPRRRVPGLHVGKVWMEPDFDVPPREGVWVNPV